MNKKKIPAGPTRNEDYRKLLVAADQKSQEDFDKTVLSLSGGALGISFVFFKDVIGPNPIHAPELLFTSWLAWGASTCFVLLSYYLSHRAIRAAIQHLDQGTLDETNPGGIYNTATAVLNVIGALLFFLGVVTIIFFANSNLNAKGSSDVSTQTPTSATSPAATVSATSRTPHAPQK